MNERIQKLMIRAIGGVPCYDASVGLSLNQEESEKFAELIVQECMDLALSEQKRYAAFTHRNLSECVVTVSNFRLLMKDHFGVENERD